MAIDFTVFYPRIGVLAETGVLVNDYRSSTLSTRVADIDSAYAGSPQLKEGLYSQETSQDQAAGQFNNYLQSLAIATLFDSVDADRPLVNKSVGAYLTELDRQQRAQGIKLSTSAATVGTVTQGTSTIGDESIVISGKTVAGVQSDSVLPENLRVDCIVDSTTGGTLWQEVIQISGTAPETDKLGPLWPEGSGTNFTMTLRDPAIDGTVVNAALNTYTVLDVPDSWTVVAGTASTDFEEWVSTLPRADSTGCLRIMPTTTTVTLKQAVTLQPSTRYLVSIAYRVTTLSGTPSITLKLMDGSSITVADDAGTSNALTNTVASMYNTYSGTGLTSVSTNTITLTSHKLQNGDAVTFGGTGPANIVNGTTYYVRDVTTNTFTVSATRGGAVFVLGAYTSGGTISHTAAWRVKTSMFITPTVMPAAAYLTITTANTNCDILVSHVHVSPMVSMYNGGPSISAVSGVIQPSITDQFTSAITVSGTTGSVVRWAERFYGVSQYGISLLTNASPTASFDDGSLLV